MTELSANEIAMLLLKAARGGDMPVGAAEDLAEVARYLRLDDIKICPGRGADPALVFVPVALDAVAAGQGPREVTADAAIIRAYIAYYEVQLRKRLIWSETRDGAIFSHFEDGPVAHSVLGRRSMPEALHAHLTELAKNTLVPETDASRQAGAGAGLTDND
ncbi:MAG: DUF3726 domain-containing protein [Pseudomonadota bacterium]